MSKNVVGHSKLIGGVNYVTILNIGGSNGSVLGAQASPSPDTKKFSKKKHKNPFNGFLIFLLRNYLLILPRGLLLMFVLKRFEY